MALHFTTFTCHFMTRPGDSTDGIKIKNPDAPAATKVIERLRRANLERHGEGI
jgi:hypothetical protein